MLNEIAAKKSFSVCFALECTICIYLSGWRSLQAQFFVLRNDAFRVLYNIESMLPYVYIAFYCKKKKPNKLSALNKQHATQ